jgi:exopolyphosphatase/guanosine-5'-triphosphate,3'-diphosphate pyrophosphatase
MAEYFAVLDVGSNALRFQLASVEQPGTYRILEQERQAIRLGRKVFQTGTLDGESVRAALSALEDFQKSAQRYPVTAFKAVATSALREASDAPSFVAKAKEGGAPLEVISEEEEARLISLGIMSGLRFDLPLGLFIDIGGGSVEAAVANRTNTFCLFSLPLGAVRLTEKFIKSDPPSGKELKDLRRFAEERLRPAARRIEREKFTMAFGSGGTITALADTDARLTGEPRVGSLYALRRSRLKKLLDLLKDQPLSRRSALIAGDPRRADIIVAGGAVLLALMNHIGLDYLFVSNRGLRDGLMVDLLRSHYPESENLWSEEGGRPESLEQVGEKYHYDSAHAYQVSHLALNLFYQLQGLHGLPERYAGVLHAAAILHDIGLFIAYPKHHKHSYYLIKSSGPNAFNKPELDLIAGIARYHRKAHPSPKHLPFGQLSPDGQDIVRKLSALLRVADGLDCSHESRVKEIACSLPRARTVSLKISGALELKADIERAKEKAELMEEVFNVATVIQPVGRSNRD